MTEREAFGAATAEAASEGDERDGDRDLRELAPGLARIAATAAWRASGWAVSAYLRAGSRVMEAAVSGESAGDLLQSSRAELRDHARRLLGLIDEAADAGRERQDDRQSASPEELRRRGEELLNRSADVDYDEDLHPAYARILDDLAPDEVRILRLLFHEGAKPAVDVRKGIPFVPVGSELIEQGLSMIGAEAGCRHPDRVHPYLNNLNRLGLIWFSRDPVPEPGRYQVVEAQPEVVEALKRAGRLGHTLRRSIHLTPFGRDFCETCLPTGEPAGAEGGADDAEASTTGK